MAPTAFNIRTESSSQHIHQLDLSEYQIMDETADGFARKIPRHEVLVLMLNEIAVLRGRGFFFHLPARDSLTSPGGPERQPASRAPTPPRARYAPILSMDFAWSEKGRATFLADSHRARYLKASAIINPPHPITPLYAIQVATTRNHLLYANSVRSMILLATASGYHLLDSITAVRHAGRYTGRAGARDPDIALRINTAGFRAVWTPSPNDTSMSRFFKADAASVYLSIGEMQLEGVVHPSFTAGALRDILPRPAAPEPGIPLGVAIEDDPDAETENTPEPACDPQGRRMVPQKRLVGLIDEDKAEAEAEAEARPGF